MSAVSLVVGTASRPLPGQSENGDACFVRDVDGGVFFGVVDALGHGPFAALTSSLALSHLQNVDLKRGVTAAVSSLHAALKGTRGAAVLLAHFKDGVVTACGVGNVEVRRFGVKLALHLTPGVVGGVISRAPVAAVADMPRGTRLVVFSDGVSAKFGADDIAAGAGVDVIAQQLLEKFGRATDDATVLVAEAR